MSVSPDDDFAAAEFALGTLSPGERAEIAARRLREPDLDAAIRDWEERLAPLAEAAPPVEPPARIFHEIQNRIRSARSPRPATDALVVGLQQSLARWRTAAIAASCAAVLLAAGFAAREIYRPSAPREYVAILQKDAESPAFEVTVDLDRQELSVRPVAARAPPGKAYELWIIDPRLGAPRSLGVIGEGRRGAPIGRFERAVVQDATYAVTVEPPGGSPTGAPSGPPVFVGKLIPLTP